MLDSQIGRYLDRLILGALGMKEISEVLGYDINRAETLTVDHFIFEQPQEMRSLIIRVLFIMLYISLAKSDGYDMISRNKR